MFLKKQFGFTLIELMVVVAIVGILSALSITNYSTHQRKSRQAEAKLAMGSLYSLEKAFCSEYSAYIPAFDAIGYTPEGNKRFFQIEACSGVPGVTWSGTVTGYAGGASVFYYPMQNAPWSYSYILTPGNTCSSPTCNSYGNDPLTFTVNASGVLCSGCYTDFWTMDQNKHLQNCSIGTQ